MRLAGTVSHKVPRKRKDSHRQQAPLLLSSIDPRQSQPSRMPGSPHLMTQALHLKEGTAALGERTIESISEDSMEIFHIMFYFK